MLHAFYVTKDIGTVSLVESILNDAAIGSTGRLGISLRPWFEKEYVCSSIIRYQVNVIQDTCSNAAAGCVDNEVRIDVYGRRSLK